MGYFIVKDGKVINSIKYNPSGIEQGQKQYEKDVEKYESDKEKYEQLRLEYDTILTKRNKARKKMSKDNARSYLIDITDLVEPVTPTQPTMPLGEYIPLTGQELVESIQEGVAIGWSYTNGVFEKPEQEQEEQEEVVVEENQPE